jgi:hypothetical protein
VQDAALAFPRNAISRCASICALRAQCANITACTGTPHRVGGAWKNNTDTAQKTIVTATSGQNPTPQNGEAWAAFDGNVTSMWDSVVDASGSFWIDIDFGSNVSFDGLALTTEMSGVPGQGCVTIVCTVKPNCSLVCVCIDVLSHWDHAALCRAAHALLLLSLDNERGG